MDLETFRAIDVDIDLANDFVPDVILSANDYNGRCIVARVTNGGVSVNGDNLSARLLFNTAPGISTGGYVTMTRVASSPTATWQVPVPSDALAARQVMLCVQIVDSDDNLVCSRNFRGIVDRKLMDDDAPESVNELNRLWEGIDALENIDASVAADGTVSVTAPDGTVTTSTAVPTAVSAATAATNAANTAAGAANTAATDAAQAVAALQAYVPLDADNILKATETGAIVSTSDAYPSSLLGLVAYGNSVQNGTPTPETPVPIKSVAGAKACTSGKNLANFAPKSERGMTCVKNADGTVTISGTPTGDWAGFGNSIDCDLPELGPYTISITKALPYKVGCTVTADDRTTQRPSISIGSTSTTFTVSNPIKWIAFTLTSLTAGTALSAETFGFQLEQGSTATEFESASLMITPLTLIDDQGVAHELRKILMSNGTIRARDELVVNADGSGTLYENVGHVDDMSTLTWTKLTTPNTRFRASLPGFAGAWSGPRIACEAYPYVSNTSSDGEMADKSLYKRTSLGQILIRNSDYDNYTAEEFAATLSGVSISYALLTTPATYHIPAINMPSLPDLVSNAWISATDADGAAIAADIGITYRRDINKVISDLETAIADIVSA